MALRTLTWFTVCHSWSSLVRCMLWILILQRKALGTGQTRKGPGWPSTHKAEWHLDPNRSWGLPHKPRLSGFSQAIGCEPGIQRERAMERSKPEEHLGFCQATRRHPSHLYGACLEGLWQTTTRLLCWLPSAGLCQQGHSLGRDGTSCRSRAGGWSQPESVVLGELCQKFV